MEAKNEKVALVIDNEIVSTGVLIKESPLYCTVKVTSKDAMNQVQVWDPYCILYLSRLSCDIVP